jgi:RecA-family ATPase
MSNRIAVARMHAQDGEIAGLPIAWLGAVPNLSDPSEVDKMIPRLKALAEKFQSDHDVRLGAVILDTLAATCDLDDEDDNSEASRAGKELKRLSQEVGVVVLPVHHYGKAQDTGLRGASAWGALCDVISLGRGGDESSHR